MTGEAPKKTFKPYRPLLMPEEMARAHADIMILRRTIREFSSKEVSEETIAQLIRAAGSSPSGANQQPWHFVCVRDPDTKKIIRAAAERIEARFYAQISDTWREDLDPLGTDSSKPFLEDAPWLIVVFRKTLADETGSKVYFGSQSVGIAVGTLIGAIHLAGLATVPYTPRPLDFISEILGRPDTEMPYMILPVGYPADDVTIPDISRKSINDIMTVI